MCIVFVFFVYRGRNKKKRHYKSCKEDKSLFASSFSLSHTFTYIFVYEYKFKENISKKTIEY